MPLKYQPETGPGAFENRAAADEKRVPTNQIVS